MRDRGQASVELALLLPLLVLLLAALVQAGLVVRDQILLTHAAREAARAASLDDDRAAAEQAARDAGPLDGDHLDVAVSGRDGAGSQVTVEVAYTSPTALPLLGAVLDDVRLTASASMRVER